jgi:mycothiol synthase
MTALTEPLTVRAATLEDAELIGALVAEVDLAEVGTADYGVDEIREDLSGPSTHMPDDTWLAFQGDKLVCYGILWDEHGHERIDLDHYPAPGHSEAGLEVLGLMLARARQITRSRGLDKAVVHLNLTPVSPLALGELPERGWRCIRRHNVMSKAVSPETDLVPETPPGISLRHPEGEEDKRIAHSLVSQAFAEHFDFHPVSYEEWVAAQRDRFDAEFSWIASLTSPDGSSEDVGVLLSRNNRETMGWVRSLGVLKQARRMGIGALLLRNAFAAFARAGRDTVGLGVDTQNVTNALAVYEGVGMTRLYAVDTWELEVL